MDKVAFINILIQDIADDNLSDFEQTLGLMPIERLNIDASDRLLSIIMDNCMEFQRKEHLKAAYEAWTYGNPEEDTFSLLSYCMGRSLFSLDAVTFLTYTLGKGPVELFKEQLTRDDSPETLEAVIRIVSIFDLANNRERINYLIGLLQENESESKVEMLKIKQYLNSLYKELAPTAAIPEHMIPGNSGPDKELPDADLLEDVEVEIAEPDIEDIPTEEMADLLTEGLLNEGFNIDDIDRARDEIKDRLDAVDLETKKAMMLPTLKQNELQSLHDDEELFRIFGPSHPVDNNPLDGETPCGMYGGCRLFLCVCHETNGQSALVDNDLFNDDPVDPQDDIFITDWFTGNCQNCNLKIAKRCYAVRQPLVSGGYRGCYCSWKCVREGTVDNEIGIFALVDNIERKMKDIGIYDRRYDT